MLTLRNLLAMRSPLRLAAMATIMAILQARPSLQQTTSKCNPTEQSCPADPALGSSVSVDFSSGSSTAFTAQGNPTYGSGGVSLTVAKSGDSPQLASKWYIMFGHVEITLKAAPGAGIVSSSVLLSDDLDEIDWEWLGAEDGQVQSNYFGKGQTTTYDRAATHAVSDSQGSTHQYTIDWTEDRIEWQIDGNTVRTLNANDANGQYPQTPMQFKFGAWSGGDPSNPPGTIQWAHGPTDYSKAPFTMLVESISVTDYSTGTQYKYGDMSGSYSSIQAVGGKISGNSNGASDSDSAAPAVTTTSNGNFVTLASSPTATTYPGLPSGWTVNSSGKVVPPSAAPSTSQPDLSSVSPAPSVAGYCSASGYKIVTSYNMQGFPTTVTVPVGISTGWNDQGLPTTIYPGSCPTSDIPLAAGQILGQSSLSPASVSTIVTTANTPSTSASSAGVVSGSAMPALSDGPSMVRRTWIAATCTFFSALVFGFLIA